MLKAIRRPSVTLFVLYTSGGYADKCKEDYNLRLKLLKKQATSLVPQKFTGAITGVTF